MFGENQKSYIVTFFYFSIINALDAADLDWNIANLSSKYHNSKWKVQKVKLELA